ncbi:hypothetical protein Tco_0119002 [Tanacetum coccineum]
MTTSKLSSLISMRSILKGWFSKIKVQPWITLLVPTRFPSAISMSHDKLLTLGALFTQEKASSIPTVFSWGSTISPESFLSSILLLVVIIVAVVIVVVAVILVVVVV